MPFLDSNFNYLAFRAETHLLAQRSGSLLVPWVQKKTGITGAAARIVDFIGQVDMIKPEIIGGRMGAVFASTESPWVFPNFHELPLILDRIQGWNQMAPEAKEVAYRKAITEAKGRRLDEEIISAAFADRVTGERMETTTVFDATMVIADTIGSSGGATGMNGLKVMKAIQLFNSKYVRTAGRQFVCLLNSQAKFELLQDPIVTSSMYARSDRLERGEIGTWQGVTFVEYEDVGKNAAATDYELPMWDVESGIELDIWSDGEMYSGPRPDISAMPKMLYDCLYAGAARYEQTRVAKILSKI